MRFHHLFLLFIREETEKPEHFENDPLLAVFLNQSFLSVDSIVVVQMHQNENVHVSPTYQNAVP